MPATLERQSGKSTSPSSKYRSLAKQLREQIERRELQPGDRLPSFVELRARYGATPTTAERIYGLLESEGLIERRQGSGTFVAERKRILTGNIGFVGGAFVEPHKIPFDMHLMRGVQQAAATARQHLLFLGTSHGLDLSDCGKVDGILSSNIEDIRMLLRDAPAGLPLVSLLIANDNVTSVIADDYRGGKMAVEYLVSLGHRRIACLMEESPSLARRRFAGYCDGLREAGIKADPAWARLTEKIFMDQKTQPYLEWGRRQMRLWLEEGFRKLKCTALFVQNETAAIGAMQILQREGWKVPADISVMGFDGTELCDFVEPRLCAIELPLARIGAKAVEMLNLQIAGNAPEAQTIALPVSVREGDSVAPPA
jgi:DNA-binding LacI/PurR family transcriptional regulator